MIFTFNTIHRNKCSIPFLFIAVGRSLCGECALDCWTMALDGLVSRFLQPLSIYTQRAGEIRFLQPQLYPISSNADNMLYSWPTKSCCAIHGGANFSAVCVFQFSALEAYGRRQCCFLSTSNLCFTSHTQLYIPSTNKKIADSKFLLDPGVPGVHLVVKTIYSSLNCKIGCAHVPEIKICSKMMHISLSTQ